MKSLVPVLITPSSYHSGVTVNNSDIPSTSSGCEDAVERKVQGLSVPSRIQTSTFKSTGARFCDYTSFEQILPIPAERERQLSTLFPQTGVSVFQYLTSQLYYKIEWKMMNNTSIIPTSKVRYLTVDVERQIAPEPWDANGNRIVMTAPKPGKSTHGCFTIPGQYLFFVIEDKNRFLDIELSITGFLSQCPDAWNVLGCRKSCFAIQLNGRKVKAYTNTLSNVGLIERTLNPDFLEFERRILEEYYANPGLPCILGNNRSKALLTETVVTLSYEYKTYEELRPLTVFTSPCIEACCDKTYTGSLIQKLEYTGNISPDWIINAKETKQFWLGEGQKYRVSNIVVQGTAPSFAEYGNRIKSGPEFSCKRSINGILYWAPFFLFFDVGRNEPARFIPGESSKDVVVSGQKGIILPLSMNGDKFSFDGTNTSFFTLETAKNSGQPIPYTIRIDNPVWIAEVTEQDSSGFEIIVPVWKYAPSQLKVSFDITLA